MFDPTGRIGREISIFLEDGLRGDIFVQLHKQTFLTNEGVQRIIGFHIIQPVAGNETLARRRHTQINECMPERRAAKAAEMGSAA